MQRMLSPKHDPYWGKVTWQGAHAVSLADITVVFIAHVSHR